MEKVSLSTCTVHTQNLKGSNQKLKIRFETNKIACTGQVFWKYRRWLEADDEMARVYMIYEQITRSNYFFMCLMRLRKTSVGHRQVFGRLLFVLARSGRHFHGVSHRRCRLFRILCRRNGLDDMVVHLLSVLAFMCQTLGN